MRVLAISGSLRARSSNGTLIEAAALCAPGDMTVVRYHDLGNLPLFNPDIESAGLPLVVAALHALREAISAGED